MNKETIKLIVDIPKDLHFKLKMKALKEDTTIKDIVNEIIDKNIQ